METARLSSKVAAPLCIPRQQLIELLLLCVLASIWLWQFLDSVQSDRCVVVSHHCFHVHLMTYDKEHLVI